MTFDLEPDFSKALALSCAELYPILSSKIDLSLKMKKPLLFTRAFAVRKAEVNFKKAMKPWLNWDFRRSGVGSFGIDENPGYIFVQGLKSYGQKYSPHQIAIIKKDTGKILHLRLGNDSDFSSTTFLGEKDGRLFFSNSKSGVFFTDLNQPNFTILGHPISTQRASILQSDFDRTTGPISPYLVPANLETTELVSKIAWPNFNDTNVMAASMPSGDTGFVLKRTDIGRDKARVSTFRLIKYQLHETGKVTETEISKFNTTAIASYSSKGPAKIQVVGKKLYFVTDKFENESLLSLDLEKATEGPRVEIPSVLRDPVPFTHKGISYFLIEGTDNQLSVWNAVSGTTLATTQIPNLNRAMGYSLSGDGLLKVVFRDDAKVIDLKDFLIPLKKLALEAP